MELTSKVLIELQNRLKIGNRKGVHLNAIPGRSNYKFDLSKLSIIDQNLPNKFIDSLLTELPLKFRITWKDNIADINSLFEDEQLQLVKITRAFENLINQTETIESEKGINTFGFGFPLLIRRDQIDNKLTVAPILIWSLRIKRTKEFNTWEIIRTDEDPIYLNEVLINHLQNDSKVIIEQIPNEMLDDGLLRKTELIEICSYILNKINPVVDNNINEVFEKKLTSITNIKEKTHYEKLQISSTNSLIEFCGLFSIFEVQKQSIIDEFDNLMELEGLSINLDDISDNHFQSISSIETDPSQQSILNSLEAKRNILIQGPPGTGKSQTLTAILVNALENQKKTIVVCEKITALNVLYKALLKKGLSNNCILIKDVKDRRAVVDSVRERVDNSHYKQYRYNYSKENLDSLLWKVKKIIKEVNNKHQKLNTRLLGGKNWTDIVGLLLAELKDSNEENNLILDKNEFEFNTDEFNHLSDLVQIGESLYNKFKAFKNISFINPNKFNTNNPFKLEQDINNDFDYYNKEIDGILKLLNSIKEEYFNYRILAFNNKSDEIKQKSREFCDKINDFDQFLSEKLNHYRNHRIDYLSKQFSIVNKIINEIEEIFKSNGKNGYIFEEKQINGVIFKVVSIFSKVKRNTIKDYNKLQQLFNNLEDTYLFKEFNIQSFKPVLADKRNSLTDIKEKLEREKSNLENRIKSEFDNFKFHTLLVTDNVKGVFSQLDCEIPKSFNGNGYPTIIKYLENELMSYLKELDDKLADIKSLIINFNELNNEYYFIGNYKNNCNILSILKSDIDTIYKSFNSKIENDFKKFNLLLDYEELTEIKRLIELKEKCNLLIKKINSDDWLLNKIDDSSLDALISDVNSILSKREDYFSNKNDIFLNEFNWFKFYNELSGKEKKVIIELIAKNNWVKVFVIFYLDSILRNSADHNLPQNDEPLNELTKNLKDIEKEQIKYINEFWYSKQIDATSEFEFKNNGMSVKNLYNKKTGTKFKRLSLRQIVKNNPDIFTTFFPIILTTPDVCCNLFRGMNNYFDIVMFDEASQLRIEDNLPALLKGKQIVISGDEHQMPPSNYFSKIFDGSIDDEDEIEEENFKLNESDTLLESETLLEFAENLKFRKQFLDFHYRSKHPYLIDFSNNAFYNQRLKPLPNIVEYIPIKLVSVDGTFSDHSNEAEAEMVISILENNINKKPDGNYPSVGIATLNIHQRNLIKRKIQERQKFAKYAEFNDKIDKLEKHDEKFFIKNLENIQGDERDVIIISTTYGFDKNGRFAERFGPINHSKGYKLLNVIITRAKYKVYVCTSVPEQKFMNYKEYLIAEGANNRRAIFYSYLAYAKAVSEQNDEFRKSVLESLNQNSRNSIDAEIISKDLESPFEEEVYQVLRNKYDDDQIIPQMQFAGFRIDIVYVSKKKGIPKIAIECDGAKYHSSDEAYLYDTHRQKILESHGFVFHRIWSTNWWWNTNRAIEKLFSFIDKIESMTPSNTKSNDGFDYAFNDNIVPIAAYISKKQPAEVKKENSQKEFFATEDIINLPLKKPFVVKNSKVTVKYLNSGNLLKIQIVDSTHNITETNNEIRPITINSPLALAIIGHSVGEIVKIGNLDNYVEILEISI